MGILDSLTAVATFGQCSTSGCGKDHRDTSLGDSIVNAATFGQCSGSGCGNGHTSAWSPLGPVSNLLGGGSPTNPSPLTPQQQQMIEMAIIAIGGIFVLEIIFEIL